VTKFEKSDSVTIRAGKKLQNRPFDSGQQEAPLCFFLANAITRTQNLRRSYDSNPLLQTASNVP
jgi:hypothetical protein